MYTDFIEKDIDDESRPYMTMAIVGGQLIVRHFRDYTVACDVMQSYLRDGHHARFFIDRRWE